MLSYAVLSYLIPAIGMVVALGVTIVLWLSVAALISMTGGWADLATRYAASSRPKGREFRFQSAHLGGAWYSSIVTAIPCQAGLYLELERPWRFRHSPLLIPWSDVLRLSKRRSLLGTKYYRVTLSDEPPMMIRLRRAAGSEIASYLKQT